MKLFLKFKGSTLAKRSFASSRFLYELACFAAAYLPGMRNNFAIMLACMKFSEKSPTKEAQASPIKSLRPPTSASMANPS